MAAIDSDVIREVIVALKNNATIQSKIARDSKNNLSIHPGNFNLINNVFPQITVEYNDGSSEPEFPASKDSLVITIWIDKNTSEQPYSFLRIVSDAILTLFNREGGAYNKIDVPTNTGVRVCSFLKIHRFFDYDSEIKKHYCEITFEVVRSEGESFAAADAGDRLWV
jgi:hypothetical protein